MGYGQIYNTTWWGNALDTARTAGTEPDFFGSQMKLLTSNQPELVTNGDFATDSNWIKQAGWTISEGAANYNGVSSVYIQQGNVFTANTNYKITFTISNNTSGIISFRDGSAATLIPNTNYSNGSYTFYVTSNTNTSLRIYGVGGSGSLSIDNVSIKEVRLDLDQIEAKKCLADWIHVTALQDLNN